MKKFNRYVSSLLIEFTSVPGNKQVVTLFHKVLTIYVLLKLLTFYNSFPYFRKDYLDLKWYTLSLKDIALNFFSLTLVKDYQSEVMLVCMAILTLTLFIKKNTLISILVFWISFNFNRAISPVYSGAEMVLNMLLFFMIFMNCPKAHGRTIINYTLTALHNGALLICQVQIALIYLLSGFDKLLSISWRNGEAMFKILNLDYYIHPSISGVFSQNESILILLGWFVILFELILPILIWWSRTRMLIIGLGVAFHIFIAWGLSLPDFGVIMILSYIIFLENIQLSQLKKRIGVIIEALNKNLKLKLVFIN